MGVFSWLFGGKNQEKKKCVVNRVQSNSQNEDTDCRDNEKEKEKVVTGLKTWRMHGFEYTSTEFDDGSFIIKSKSGELWDTFDKLSMEIENNKDILQQIAACEASYGILSEMVRLYQNGGGLPPRIICRDMGPRLYMRLGKWDAARSAIQKCIDAKAYEYESDGRLAMKGLQDYRFAAEIACSFLSQNPGFLQDELYKALEETLADSENLEEFIRSSMLIRKEPQGETFKLFLNDPVLQESDIILS